MQIDVGELALTCGRSTRKPYTDKKRKAFNHLIALARIGAAAVECNDRRMHGTEAEWRAAQAKRNSMTLDYLMGRSSAG